MQIPEHTWGVADREYPGDYVSWNNTALEVAVNGGNPRFQVAVDAWERQRSYNAWAVQELGNGDVGVEAQQVMQQLRLLKQPPSVQNNPLYSLVYTTDNGEDAIDVPALQFSSHAWTVTLDAVTGAISSLIFKKSGSRSITAAVKKSHSESLTLPFGRKGGVTSGSADASIYNNDNNNNNNIDKNNHSADTQTSESNQEWASPTSLLAQLVYSAYDEDSYTPIWTDYVWGSPWYQEFGKVNATSMGGARRVDAVPVLKKAWCRKHHQESDDEDDSNSLHVVLEAAFDKGLVRHAGAPAAVYYEITSPSDSDDLFIDVILENKTATRLPEALWLRWEPALPAVDANSWVMSKLGSWISPLEVIRNGSMGMHAVDDGGVAVRSADGAAVLSIRSLDAALVSPGSATPFPSVVTLPDLSKGMHFNLVNNIWGTNYVMWFPYRKGRGKGKGRDDDGGGNGDENLRFRFVVQIEDVMAPSANDGGVYAEQ